MPITFNRRPLTVNTPSSSDVKQYYINQNAFTGINESKNYLTVDQNSFSDCNNVYVDEFGLLRSRPSLKRDEKYSNTFLAVYDFDKFVCIVGANSLYVYVDDVKKAEKSVAGVSKDTPVVLKDNHLFLFGSTFHVFDVTNPESIVTKNIKDFLYPPNKSTDDEIGIEADNLLASGSKNVYTNRDEIYSNIDDGKIVTASVDGKTYNLVYDDRFFQRVFYKDYRVPSYYTNNWKNIAVTQKPDGEYIYAIYHEDVNDVHLIDGIADISLGKIVIGLTVCTVFEGGLQFSDDGQYLIAITNEGYFRYKILESDSKWELVFEYKAYRKSERYFWPSTNFSVFNCDFAGCHFLTGTNYLLQYKLTFGKTDENDSVQSCLVRVLRTDEGYVNLPGAGTIGSGYFSASDDLALEGTDHNILVISEDYDRVVNTGEFFICACHLELATNHLQFVTSYDYNNGGHISTYLLQSYSEGFNKDVTNSLLSASTTELGYHCDKFSISFITIENGIYGSTPLSLVDNTFHYLLDDVRISSHYYDAEQYNILLYTPDTYVTDEAITFSNRTYNSNAANMLPFNDFHPLYIGHDVILYKDGYIYTNVYGTSELLVSITDALTPNPAKLHFTDYALLQQYYFVDGSKVYITDNMYDDNGIVQWYIHDYQDFGEKIVNIHKISTTEVAIFTPTSIWYITFDSEKNVYRYTKSVIPLGSIINSDVITSFDGTRIIFPTSQGLAALTYQDFVATTEQALTFLTDNVKSLYKDFSKTGVRFCQYNYWLICYSPDSNICMLYDYRNGGWWKWTFWNNVENVFVIGNQLKFAISIRSYNIDNSLNDYYDASDHSINWSIKSQPMHLGSPNNYKHISNLMLDTVIDADLYDNCTYELKVYNYRDIVRDAKPEVVVYNVDSFKAFNKRLNYPKVVNFQYELNNIDNLSHNIPLSLANISIKYGVKGEVR